MKVVEIYREISVVLCKSVSCSSPVNVVHTASVSWETNNCIPVESRMLIADSGWENLILTIIDMVYKYKKIYC